jgi:hypothetical protein
MNAGWIIGLFEFHDHIINRQAVACGGVDFGHHTFAFCAQDVFHFHRLNGA